MPREPFLHKANQSLVRQSLKISEVHNTQSPGWIRALGQKVRAGARPGGCGPEGAGADSQVPLFLGTKGDTLDWKWQKESLEAFGGAPPFRDRGLVPGTELIHKERSEMLTNGFHYRGAASTLAVCVCSAFVFLFSSFHGL